MNKKKYPDNIVYDHDTDEFNAYKKEYPTDLAAPAFTKDNLIPIKNDATRRASEYFTAKVEELKDEYRKLVEEYNWTTLCYSADFRMQPKLNDIYHMYEADDKSLFMTIIAPNEWGISKVRKKNPKYVGSFKYTTIGKWEKVEI